MKDWFKDKIWDWLFADDHAKNQRALIDDLSSEKDQNFSTKSFLSQQLFNAEQELTGEKIKTASLEEKVEQLGQIIENREAVHKLEQIARVDKVADRNHDLWNKRKINLKNVKTIKYKADMKIKYIKDPHEPNLVLPIKVEKGDSALSVFSPADYELDPGGVALISLGYSLEMPKGYVAKIHAAPGLDRWNATFGVQTTVFNNGERLSVSLSNRSLRDNLRIKAGDRIAMFVVEKTEEVELNSEENAN